MIDDEVTLVDEVLHLKFDLLRVSNDGIMTERGKTLGD
jgi:hypothetical protein